MRDRRGQLDISFGMIFSIIVIIAVLAIGFYVIRYFTSLSACTSAGMFYQDLSKSVDQAWASTSSSAVFTSSVPGAVEKVCFGNLTQPTESGSKDEYSALQNRYPFGGRNNVYLYPVGVNTCTPDLGSYFIDHMQTSSFFCVSAKNGAVSVVVSKDSQDVLAKVQAKT